MKLLQRRKYFGALLIALLMTAACSKKEAVAPADDAFEELKAMAEQAEKKKQLEETRKAVNELIKSSGTTSSPQTPAYPDLYDEHLSETKKQTRAMEGIHDELKKQREEMERDNLFKRLDF